MTDFGLAKESVKGLGPGAYLVNILPSTVLIVGSLALVTSRLYPWASPMMDKHGSPVPAGPGSIVESVQRLGSVGGVLLALTVLITAVVLRPFQISMVQVLEGYWRDRLLLAPAEALAIERHVRRWSLNAARMLEFAEKKVPAEFDAVVRLARREIHASRRVDDAAAIIGQYPDETHWIMPTLLGNVLRRAEKSSGERYGLDTVITYPRLYPHLSPRLHQETETQLNIIDTASALTIMLGILSGLASPLIARLDGWSAIPIVLTGLSVLSYRGARLAAERYGIMLAAAFDLHRFDMLKSMHRRLPVDAEDEYAGNLALCRVLGGSRPIDEKEPGQWAYAHPEAASTDSTDPGAAAEPDTAADGDSAN